MLEKLEMLLLQIKKLFLSVPPFVGLILSGCVFEPANFGDSSYTINITLNDRANNKNLAGNEVIVEVFRAGFPMGSYYRKKFASTDDKGKANFSVTYKGPIKIISQPCVESISGDVYSLSKEDISPGKVFDIFLTIDSAFCEGL